MTKIKPTSIPEALQLLGNPDAKLQILDETAEIAPPVAEFAPLTDAERAYVRQLGNPYASLSIATELTEVISVNPAPTNAAASAEATSGYVSKKDFVAECRRIFHQYIPALEKSRLRPEHREFITRNQSRAAGIRYRLLEQLRKYDLSSVVGLHAQFNREGALKATKLDQIERAVVSKKE